MSNKSNEVNKEVTDLKLVTVELKDKGTSFNDVVGKVHFSSSKAVQEVRLTPTISRAIRQGVLTQTTSARLEEFTSEREKALAEHRASKKKSNKALEESATTINQKLAAKVEELATANAELVGANELLEAKDKDIEKLNKEIVKLNKDLEKPKK